LNSILNSFFYKLAIGYEGNYTSNLKPTSILHKLFYMKARSYCKYF